MPANARLGFALQFRNARRCLNLVIPSQLPMTSKLPDEEAQLFYLDTSVHLPDQGVDVVLSVAQVTTLNEVLELPRPEAASRVAELEGP